MRKEAKNTCKKEVLRFARFAHRDLYKILMGVLLISNGGSEITAEFPGLPIFSNDYVQKVKKSYPTDF